MSIRNKNIKMITKVLSSDVSQSVGGQVPSGMKRYVTFVRIDTGSAADKVAAGASAANCFLASVSVSNPTKASIIATGNRKMLLFLRSTQQTGANKAPLQVPLIPNNNAPLFTITASHWLGVLATKTTTVLTFGYYDE